MSGGEGPDGEVVRRGLGRHADRLERIPDDAVRCPLLPVGNPGVYDVATNEAVAGVGADPSHRPSRQRYRTATTSLLWPQLNENVQQPASGTLMIDGLKGPGVGSPSTRR